MSYANIIQKVQSAKWAIEPTYMAAIQTFFNSKLSGEAVDMSAFVKSAARGVTVKHYLPGHAQALEDIEVSIGYNPSGSGLSELSPSAVAALVPVAEPNTSASNTAAVENQTVVIFAGGILGKHISSMEEICAGGLSVDRLQAELIKAANDPSVSNIVLHLHSPGGVVTGIPETADLVAEIAKAKKLVAYCDSLCASAAIWIAAACGRIYLTKSAELGSIEVYSAYTDLSEAYAKAGIKVKVFTGGIHKAAGYPGTSLTEAQSALIASDVKDCAAAFKADIRKYRGAIKDETMQGQCFTGQAAIDAGLADELVSSLADVLRDLATLT